MRGSAVCARARFRALSRPRACTIQRKAPHIGRTNHLELVQRPIDPETRTRGRGRKGRETGKTPADGAGQPR